MITNLSVFRTWARARLNVTEDNERGANLVEYILLIAFIALVVAVAVVALGNTVHDKFTDSNTCLNNNPPQACN